MLAVPQVREYNLTPLSRSAGIGQIPEKRVDYRTQATPQPAMQSNHAPDFLEDVYSDDDNAVVNDYVANPRAQPRAQLYDSEPSEACDNVRNASPEADARTVYDNDYDDEAEQQRSPSTMSHHSTYHCPSSPQSVVSYADEDLDDSMPSGSAIRPPRASFRQPSSSYATAPESSRKVRRVVEPREGRHRARKGDYEPEAQEILCNAIVLFKSYVCSQDAYPDKLTEKTWAVEAWQSAAAKLQIDMAPDNEILTVIAQYSWNLRGEVKTTARALVQGAFGFKTGLTPVSRVYNQEHAAAMKRGRAFVYESIGETVDDHLGLYEAEIIQDVINRVFYKSPSDDGIQLADAYDPFPFVGLALILTAIECCIDEWESGTFSKVTFSEENYGAVYQRHLQELRAFEAESGADRILTDICKQISARGRACAKAPAMSRAGTSVLSRAAMSDAVTAYKRRKEAALAASGSQSQAPRSGSARSHHL
ncbi:hypothetical protein BN946_scf184935.g3 [Trametes cinnabarina]|uniref:DUF6532 domain-containing protein n=1 Tax=Pycnoporus cinnabarinus TaxID=5643 RepID=A0A060SLS2_PYCCI|nr:hypothetical protein BN946_scf184935.g3 [Trametes cinnabarina]